MKPKSPIIPFFIFCLLGAMISLFLVNHHIESEYGLASGQSLCSFSEGFDCDKVNTSEFSKLFGIPVAAYALFFFLALGLFVLSAQRYFRVSQETLWNAVLFSTATALVPCVYLLWVSAALIKVFCPFCLMLDLTVLLLFVIAARSCWQRGLANSISAGFIAYLNFALSLLSAKVRPFIGFVALCLILLLSLSSVTVLNDFVHRPRADRRKEAVGLFVQQWFENWKQLEPDPAPIILLQSGFGDFHLGALDAKFTVIEFADFQCPACKRASETLKRILEKHKSTTSFVFKSYPLDISCNPHMERAVFPLSCKAAAMVRCAGEQGGDKFWQMHDSLFATQFLTASSLAEIPSEIGLDPTSFEQCIEGPAVKRRLLQDIELGHRLGVTATPSFFIYSAGKILRVPSIEALDDLLSHLAKEQ